MQITKKITAVSLTAALAAASLGITAYADDAIKVMINGKALNIPEGDTQPFIENDRTLVPMRAIFEALGAQVEWDGEMQTVVSYDPVSEVSITMQIGNDNMFVGETPVKLDVPAKIVNDRTVVPVRAVAEGMHSEVGWDGATRTVTVTKDMTAKSGAPVSADANSGSLQVANPWSEYKTLAELNQALDNSDGVKYQVADPSEPAAVKENGYRYLASANMTEILASWEEGSGGDVVIRTIPGEAEDQSYITGIYNAEKTEEYTLEDGTIVSVYSYDEAGTILAVWQYDGLTHSIAVTTSDMTAADIVTKLVEDVWEHYPKG